MTVYDYVARMTDRQKVVLVCYNRFDEQQYYGSADDLPFRLCAKIISKHSIQILPVDYAIVVKIYLA